MATEAAIAVRDIVGAALRDEGVPDELVPRAERLPTTFVIGFVASEVAGRLAAHDQAVHDGDLEWAWREIVARLPSLETTAVEGDG